MYLSISDRRRFLKQAHQHMTTCRDELTSIPVTNTNVALAIARVVETSVLLRFLLDNEEEEEEALSPINPPTPEAEGLV